jgi:hypothetical protein
MTTNVEAILNIIGDLVTDKRQLKHLVFERDRRSARLVADTWPLGPVDNQPNLIRTPLSRRRHLLPEFGKGPCDQYRRGL